MWNRSLTKVWKGSKKVGWGGQTETLKTKTP
jgi:hypothetical protein